MIAAPFERFESHFHHVTDLEPTDQLRPRCQVTPQWCGANPRHESEQIIGGAKSSDRCRFHHLDGNVYRELLFVYFDLRRG